MVSLEPSSFEASNMETSKGEGFDDFCARERERE